MTGWLDINIEQMTPDQVRAVEAVAIAVGVLYCFLGYRALKFVLALTGFALAGTVAGTLAGFLTYGRLLYVAVAACLGGVAGAFALLFLYRVGVFCVGVLAVVLAANNLLSGQTEPWVTTAVLAASFLGGISALLVERPVITIATASIGAWVVVHGLAFFLIGSGSFEELYTSLEDPLMQWGFFASWAGLFVLGTFTQFVTHKRSPGKAQ